MENNKTFWNHIINNTAFDLYIITPLTAYIKYIQVTARWDTANHIISFHQDNNDILPRNRRIVFTFQDLQTDTLTCPGIVYTLNPNQVEKSYIDFRKEVIRNFQESKQQLERKIKELDKQISKQYELIENPDIHCGIKK